MTRIQCPQESCIHWLDGLCGSSEIELEAHTLVCLTFEDTADVDVPTTSVQLGDADVDDVVIDWDDDDSLIEDELDERLYENKALDLRGNLDEDDLFADEFDDKFDEDYDEVDDFEELGFSVSNGLSEDEFFDLARKRNR